VTAALLTRMAEALQDCADDLQAELDARYGGTQYQHQSQALRHERDSLPVQRAREILFEWEALKRQG
jgi:hypothetical protein